MRLFVDMLGAGHVSTSGVVGVLVAFTLALGARLVLPPYERHYARLPLVFAFLYVACLVARAALPAAASADRPLTLAALVLLLASIGRSGFLIVVHAVLARRLAYPLPKIVQDIIQIGVYSAVTLIVLRAAGVEPGSLLATSALLTAVIGLSLQETLGNLFAGLAIQAQRPFEVGDWIQFDDKPEHIGRVVEINWRATSILTLDDFEVTVPNGVLARAPIRNYSKPSAVARRSVYVFAPYTASPGRVRQLLNEPLLEVHGVLARPPPSVIVSDYTERGIQYWVRFYIDDFAERDVIGAIVRERLWYALERAGLRIPAPLREVELHQVSAETLERARTERTAARARAIANVDFLRLLPDSARKRLAELLETRLYGADELIIHQGETGSEFFIIEHGEVVVLLDTTDGKQVEVAVLGAGKFFGEMSLLTGEPRRATVRSKTECDVLVIGKRAFQEIIATHQPVLQEMSEVLVWRDDQLGERAASVEDRASLVPTEKGQLLLHRIRQFFSL